MKFHDGMVHAPGVPFIRCMPNLVGACIKRTEEVVTCMECLTLER